MPETFDPAKKSTNAVLSNGNLTIATVPAAYSSALTITGQTLGKRYAEWTVNALGGSSAISIGIGNVSANLGSIAGTDTNSCGWSRFDNSFRFNNSQVAAPIGTVSAGSRLDVAVDFGLPDMWIRGPSGLWNNNASANPATGVNGLRALSYATLNTLFASALYLMGSAFSNSQGTINTGDTAFSGAMPAGFIAWNGTFVAGTVQARAMVLA